MAAYYNENDPRAAAWLRELIKAGLIADGDVDDRSITEVKGKDLAGYTQCHFFAGIGGWSYALRLAGWKDHDPVWTGSCPCQPFSQAGKQKGTDDSRHLWTEFYRLIAECGPAVCFGEQVASPLGRDWLSGVRSDLEKVGYAVGAADLCAAGVGAPHIRQRLYWVAQSGNRGSDRRLLQKCGESFRASKSQSSSLAERSGFAINVGNRFSPGLEVGPVDQNRLGAIRNEGKAAGAPGLGNDTGRDAGRTSQCAWSDCRFIYMRDGKTRRIPIEPAFFPLANGISGRVGLLRGYGNAIVPQAAAEFISAFVDVAASVVFAVKK